ncbi:16S rRNA (adenine(1518)-N(6)/adenine(1519)-N(6))-dimethyltransferase RsmA [bacterium]|nr:16S rRNA (adenine(1518)-N(6)/adenine(1519)-N(6))-dimethyltransferase RsmA [bacterium]MCI0606092.1 16S rRNA (adenine(1518)-N(6)/adenine(1519)-N(6))-dimethyltransferase RsmA [bacterium]
MKTPIPPAPKRRLGQNFLCDQNILRKIIDFIHPTAGDFFVEIGAGTGALTALLTPHVARLIAVELDADLLPYLQNIPDITLLHSDIRKVDLCEIRADGKIRVTGNLPYYISSNILTSLILQRKCIQDMTLMFQEEVAHRITAPPSDPDYGYLSVITQYYCNIRKGFKINKNCFVPKPEIESRVLRFEFRTEPAIQFEEFASFLEKAFSQRRKKLRNNLLRALPIPAPSLDRTFDELQLSQDVRAENLSAVQYEKLILRLRT